MQWHDVPLLDDAAFPPWAGGVVVPAWAIGVDTPRADDVVVPRVDGVFVAPRAYDVDAPRANFMSFEKKCDKS